MKKAQEKQVSITYQEAESTADWLDNLAMALGLTRNDKGKIVSNRSAIVNRIIDNVKNSKKAQEFFIAEEQERLRKAFEPSE